MSPTPATRLIAALEVLARPFARCLAHYWQLGHIGPKLLTSVVFCTIIGPINLCLRLAGIPVGAKSDGQYWLIFLPLLFVIGVSSEIFIARLAKQMGSSDKPSRIDWMLFWVAPMAGLIGFVLSSL